MTEAHAPGKLVVCGEYAVLAGAPAIAVAIDVTAYARVSAAGNCLLSMAGDAAWRFEWDARGLPRWRDAPPAGQGRVLDATCATLAAAGLTPVPALAISLDTRAFLARRDAGGAEKLGLGSSAAITTALTAALLAQRGGARPEPALVMELSHAAHRRLQDGAGSGIDVAAALHGGTVALIPSATATAPGVESLAWPAGLHWLAAWSGRGAATPALLSRLEQFRGADPVGFAQVMAPLCAAAAQALAAWKGGAAADVLAALRVCQDRLLALDAAGGLGIWTAAHQRLADVAAAAGAFYKTSGAGGGDFGLAFCTSADVMSRLARDYAALGVMTVGGRADVAGLVLRS